MAFVPQSKLTIEVTRFLEHTGYNLYTIWLFTLSDLKTIVGPSTAFGIVSALAGSIIIVEPTTSATVIGNTPLVAFWAWINLLPFTISNQRKPEAIVEDSLNKPWRPMPSKRFSPQTAKRLMIATHFLALISSRYSGGFYQSAILVLLSVWYNDCGGADSNCFVRNIINSCGYMCYTSGALEVAVYPSKTLLQPIGYYWLAVIGLVVLTTIHLQDLYDQAGDSLRGRWTVPLVVGDRIARRVIATMVALWSLLCPRLWGLPHVGYLLPVGLALIIMWRLFNKRQVMADKHTFRVYNVWIVSLYSLPLIKAWSIS